jgi:hypothetical protein
MTDQEVIAALMESPPEIKDTPALLFGYLSPGGWWRRNRNTFGHLIWQPEVLTLDKLHIVEKQLTADQWYIYARHIAMAVGEASLSFEKRLIHADVAIKTAALAAVLRTA